jgi:hypothetical protein
MPHNELHDRRKRKNLAVGGGIVAFIAIVFIITILRLKAGMM